MYRISTYTNLPYRSALHVGKYSSPMDPMGTYLSIYPASQRPLKINSPPGIVDGKFLLKIIDFFQNVPTLNGKKWTCRVYIYIPMKQHYIFHLS